MIGVLGSRGMVYLDDDRVRPLLLRRRRRLDRVRHRHEKADNSSDAV